MPNSAANTRSKAPYMQVVTLLVPDDHFCNFCGRKAPILRSCSKCQAMVCEQPKETAQGCVAFKQGLAHPFFCPWCARDQLVKEVCRSSR